MAIRGRVVSRQRVCKYCGDLHEVSRWPDNCKDNGWPRSDLPAPYLISDNLPGGVNGLYHHAARKKIDSKSAYRQATRDHGCVELGNEYDAATAERPQEEISQNLVESAVNDALAEHGIVSDSDTGKLDYGVT